MICPEMFYRKRIHGLAEKILTYLETLPVGEETTTHEVLIQLYGKECWENGDYIIDGEKVENLEIVRVDFMVRRNAKRHGLILDSSKYDDLVTGLPMHIGYIVKKK